MSARKEGKIEPTRPEDEIINSVIVHKTRPPEVTKVAEARRCKEERRMIEERQLSSDSDGMHHQILIDGMDIFEAARKGRQDVIDNILELDNKAINSVDWGGNTPLQLACMMRNYEIAGRMIDRGADPLLLDGIGRNAFSYVSDAMVCETMKRKHGLTTKKVQVVTEYLSEEQKTFLMLREAAYAGNFETVKRFIAADSKLIHATDTKRHTALMYACMTGQHHVAVYLVECGADIRAKCDYAVDAIGFLVDPHKKKKLIELAFRLSPAGIAQAVAKAAKEQADELARMECETLGMMSEEQRTRALIKRAFDIRQRVRRSMVRQLVTDVIESTCTAHTIAYVKRKQEEEEEAERQARREEEERRRIKAEQDRIRLEAAREKIRLEKLHQEKLKLEVEEAQAAAAKMAEKQADLDSAKEKMRAEMRRKALREAELAALLEWNMIEAAEERKQQAQFKKEKPKRIEKYVRLRHGAAKI